MQDDLNFQDDELQELRDRVASLTEQLEIRTQQADALAQQVLEGPGDAPGKRRIPWLLVWWCVLAAAAFVARAEDGARGTELVFFVFIVTPIVIIYAKFYRRVLRWIAGWCK